MKPMLPQSFQTSALSEVCVPTAAGRLSARVIRPAIVTAARPLIVLHGISRNAERLAELFRPEAERSGRLIVVPHFDAARWTHFQRPCRAARPDQALIGLIEHLAAAHPELDGAVDLFGHSGGAQLAHRTAMLYPQRFGTLHLAAAGWYCLPDTRMPYPYGLGTRATDPAAAAWLRRKRATLAAYLGRETHIYVGTDDTARDPALRKTRPLDRVQGRTRRDRAHAYRAAFEDAARAAGITPRVTLTELPGCAHDVEQAIATAGLAARVVRGRDS
ncbi:alpha/beta fold hydrolase [Roseivivax isoporae]|uniref:Hydrolase n=1 Tax=Roseivivax isoporae LMG 25204 TaxID=1449351 RepID=X7F1W9_9RHOB|nr:alpha/beta hydrolase [Roseivivax isoporae]ETX26907.1 hypothetical protein RISW2_17695 [Roseivivax isoporae LMG 25204]